MPQEFQIESYLSSKQLNHQSVSLVIPRIARDKIHNAMYYRVNLNTVSLRGDTIECLSKVIVRDLGSLAEPVSFQQVHVLGGIEFQCLLMKLVEIRPTWDQLEVMLQEDNTGFNNKYIVGLILAYIRIQYYFLQVEDPLAQRFRVLFKHYYNDYRKMKSVLFDQDCWTKSQTVSVNILHMDELVEWLLEREEIWGIPLGKCQWKELEESSSDESD
ncbi:PRP38 (YGR075C) [Zygosaccharomyces parabailii]|uniref:Pre-mRNA-splicing factor 38 n=1 Tax=Zygosaccharomyces bailii (strain CLIB 213 / ATCC 58445 / CBS 680 / BCRC 21525 / NBRC 1098 / NCYC 1416 / NRRL Y-2227) TaxID=1333698 RepID=A0A8J2T4A7_ZYGB2|nr:PRP38 (YGR075C) [Zygosaccharomyces parabailii]CDF87602.1 BN860_10176g1_1 [Zygosaccharomyces bailii CLIB 213]CDH15344.1 related to Pre-mRNA-splicing factor 38 [Zygosaccharomyces bailii ISA1307]